MQLPDEAIEYDYRAEKLAVNQAKVAKEFAYFTGVEMLMLIEDHQKVPSRLRVICTDRRTGPRSVRRPAGSPATRRV